jgi:hypothetical protein
MSDMDNKENDLVEVTKAAEILGYKTSKSVRDLIAKGRLSAYKRPLGRKILVSIREVKKINQPVLISKGDLNV